MEMPFQVQKENNFAFIDGANLHQRLKQLGWELDLVLNAVVGEGRKLG